MTTGGERLQRAQLLKKEALGAHNHSVTMSKNLAALAFGVAEADFVRLSEKNLSLVVQPIGNEVIVSLQSCIVDWRRDLWQELLQTLQRGRSETSRLKEAYLFTFALTQRILEGQTEEVAELIPPGRLMDLSEFQSFWRNLETGGSVEDDPEFLQVILYSLFGALPDGIKQDLVNRSLTPQEVMSN